MNLNNFTNKAQEAIVGSQAIAQEYSHQEIEPAHLLLSLMRQTDGVVPQVVAKIGARPQALVTDLENILQGKPHVYGAKAQIGLSRPASEVLTRAEREAKQMKDEYVSTEHILLA